MLRQLVVTQWSHLLAGLLPRVLLVPIFGLMFTFEHSAVALQQYQELPSVSWNFELNVADVIKGNHTSLWAAIGKLVVPFVVGIASTAFFVGGRSRDMSDLLKWKAEAATHIQKMDDEGTKAGKRGAESGWKELGRFETRLKTAEDATRKIDTMALKIENLEKRQEELVQHPSNKPVKGDGR
jgi:hypothetical protein